MRILTAARASGELAPGQRIIEASTGNTGVALAMYGRYLGHPVDVCVPESVYPEIEELLAAYGANVIRVPRQAGIKTAREVARKRAVETGAYYLGQFDSPENVQAHYEGTAGEILADLPRVDVFIAGMGTGGTITGVGRRLKEANPACHVFGVEPRLGVHVQGLKSLKDGFIPPVLDESVLDGKIIVGNRHAFSHARRAMLAEGLFGGISSGAVLHAAMRAAWPHQTRQHRDGVRGRRLEVSRHGPLVHGRCGPRVRSARGPAGRRPLVVGFRPIFNAVVPWAASSSTWFYAFATCPSI